MRLKLHILRVIQARIFRRADGVILLTQYARDVVMSTMKATAGRTPIVPHGVGERFVRAPREQLALSGYSVNRPLRVLYVSIVDVYKHQWHVAEVVAQLRASGLPVTLDLIGPAYSPALKRLRRILTRLDPSAEFLRYSGAVPHHELHASYAQADICLFASSCEDLPIILLGGMASGLASACSNRGPMREVLGDAGIYFDPEDAEDIARARRTLIASPDLRARLARASVERSREVSWARCAGETFGFLSALAQRQSPTVHTPNHS